MIAALNNDTSFLICALLLAVGLGLVIGSELWQSKRSQMLLNRWAKQNHFKLISAQRRRLAAGPFWWRRSKAQTVYRIAALDSTGKCHYGYARCGGWWLGLLADIINVKWDRSMRENAPPDFAATINPHQDDQHT